MHKLCTVPVPVPGSGSCIALSLYRCIAVSLYRFLVVAIIESQLPIYGNTPQNTDYIHNTHTSCSLQGENHNQLDVHLPSRHSQQSLQSQEGEILDRPNVSSEEPQFLQRNISHHNADGQRVGQSTHQRVVLIGDSIIKGIVS